MPSFHGDSLGSLSFKGICCYHRVTSTSWRPTQKNKSPALAGFMTACISLKPYVSGSIKQFYIYLNKTSLRAFPPVEWINIILIIFMEKIKHRQRLSGLANEKGRNVTSLGFSGFSPNNVALHNKNWDFLYIWTSVIHTWKLLFLPSPRLPPPAVQCQAV